MIEIIKSAYTLFGDNKEFVALATIAIYTVKQYTATKVQKATCDGKFKNQESKIITIEKASLKATEDSTAALKASEVSEGLATKAYHCVTRINTKVNRIEKTVTEMHKDYKKYIDEKHNESLTLDK